MQEQMFSYPENDQNIRHFLARKGKKNLLVITLHPRTTDMDSSDPVFKNILAIAENNGYDGWLLAHLYPKIAATPDRLPETPDRDLVSTNWDLLGAVISNDDFAIQDVWLAWGDQPQFHPFQYPQKLIVQLRSRLERYNLNYLSIGTTKNGNPADPSPHSLKSLLQLPEEIKLIPFNFKSYSKNIRLKLNMGPDLTFGDFPFNREL